MKVGTKGSASKTKTAAKPKSAPKAKSQAAAKAAAAAPVPDFPGVRNSMESLSDGLRISLHAAPKVGKTVTALGSTGELDTEDFPPKKPVRIEKVLHISWDSGALQGLVPLGISVDEFPARRVLFEKNIFEAMKQAKEAMLWAIKAGKEVIIHDTITSLNNELKSALVEGQHDTRRAWNSVLCTHNNYFRFCDSLPVHHIFLFHSTYRPEETEEQQLRKEASRMPGGGELQLDINGQAGGCYRGHSSIIFGMTATRVVSGAKKGEFTRQIHSLPSANLEAGCRFPSNLMPPTMPPNMKKVIDLLSGVL